IELSVPVGVAPYMICSAAADHLYVSNWGGDPPGKEDVQGPASGTPLRRDPRTRVADHGSVSVLRLAEGRLPQVKSIAVGGHPSGMLLSPKSRYLYVANANSDTVSVIDTETDAVVETIACRPAARLPFGSGSNALALSPDGARLYVANGTNNCLAVIQLGAAAREENLPGTPGGSSV